MDDEDDHDDDLVALRLVVELARVVLQGLIRNCNVGLHSYGFCSIWNSHKGAQGFIFMKYFNALRQKS